MILAGLFFSFMVCLIKLLGSRIPSYEIVFFLGQWCMIQSFRLGEATAVAPAGYTRVIFATIIGYWFFAELPDTLSLVGIVIVIGSNLILIYKEGQVNKTEPGDVT